MDDAINVSKPLCPRCRGRKPGSTEDRCTLEVQEGAVGVVQDDGVVVEEVGTRLTSFLLCTNCEWAEEVHLIRLEVA
jgi:hypothetical protein